MIIAIYGSRHQDGFINDIISLLNSLLSAGNSLVIHPKIAEYLTNASGNSAFLSLSPQIEIRESSPHADVALSIGGDGTFLRTAQWIDDSETPIIGVNTGHLGFLAPFTIREVNDECKRFVSGNSKIESRSLLCIERADGTPLDTRPYALNELVIQKRDCASMVTISARINGSHLADYMCDGLIVSTPTGSTAYNLSAGGPIVTPDAPNFVISPIAAHTLTMRPLVIGDDAVIELRTNSRAKSFNIAVDGRSLSLPCGVSLFVSKAPFTVRTVMKQGHNFFSTLREKLLWGTSATSAK